MSNPLQLSKTCVACGIQKPLSAFLQISGPQGTMYGNVCSTCRGSGLDKKIIVPEAEDEQSSSSSGLKIDLKTKVQIEREKRKLAEEKIVREEKELDKKETLTDEKLDRKEEKEQAEKKHRENYIEPRKKDSFLNFQSKKVDPKQPLKMAQERTLFTERQTTVEQIAKVEGERQEQAVKQDVKERGIDLTDIHTEQYVAGKAKFGAEFNKVKAWLGKSAPMSSVERQFGIAKKESVAPKEGKDSLIDMVKENWEPKAPGTGRKR